MARSSIGVVASAKVSAGGGGFDPLSIGWTHAFWAADPSWSNPGDGNAVSSWLDSGTSADDATQGTAGARPTYRSGYANLSNEPAVEFDGGDYLDTTGGSGVNALGQANHVYIVGYQAAGGGNPTLLDGIAGGERHLCRVRHGATMLLYAGSVATVGTALSGVSFQFAALFNGASSSLRCNGQSFSALNVGSEPLGDLRIAAGGGGPAADFLTGAIAFVGVKDSALTSTELDDLDDWAVATYGVPAL